MVDKQNFHHYSIVASAEIVSVVQMTHGRSLEIYEMTDFIEENEHAACGNTSQTESLIPIRVKLGCVEERVIELNRGASVDRILEIVAEERGFNIKELVLTCEGHDTPLTSGELVDTGYPNQLTHHIHYLGEVKITVNYQAGQIYREFKRFEAVKDVLSWAIHQFKIDSSLATELVLVCHGQRDELAEREHIGHLAGQNHDLEFDLVRGDIANGGVA